MAAIATPIVPALFNELNQGQSDRSLEVHLFSKHLQFLDWKEAGQMAAELGFAGLDLTVRPKGHVLPKNVTTDLPAAIQDIKQSGSSCEMITTVISDATDSTDIGVITAAALEKVKYYRSNWFKYSEDLSLEESLDYYKEKIRELGDLNKKHNIVGCYQNHSGTSIGASVWEVKKILETADPKYFGAQYDIRHAVAEGGQSWPNGAKLLKGHIKTIVLKDFKWGKINGKWKPVNVPIGEGMVDFARYFKLLKRYSLRPPASLHLEYPLGGSEHGHFSISVDKKVIFKAMKNDLNTIQKLWKHA